MHANSQHNQNMELQTGGLASYTPSYTLSTQGTVRSFYRLSKRTTCKVCFSIEMESYYEKKRQQMSSSFHGNVAHNSTDEQIEFSFPHRKMGMMTGSDTWNCVDEIPKERLDANTVSYSLSRRCSEHLSLSWSSSSTSSLCDIHKEVSHGVSFFAICEMNDSYHDRVGEDAEIEYQGGNELKSPTSSTTCIENGSAEFSIPLKLLIPDL
jgi:hypothetical protein